MNRYYQTSIAHEELRNNSVCIKDGNHIINIRDAFDLETETFVFVCNLDTIKNKVTIINKGELVRWFKVRM